MSFFIKNRLKSFRYAFSGCLYVVRTQPNAWIHIFFTLAALVMSLWLNISFWDWAVIIFAITLVWVSELFNTALEAVIDLVSQDQNHLARISKDVGAAAVLLAAITSVIIGLLILGPPLWKQISP
jgi:diacylglycerol kinase (ATP)